MAGERYGRPVQWGLSISLSEELGDPGVVAEVAVAAEAAGWHGVFVWDHLWNRTLEPFADPFVTLAAIAVATDRVQIGTMVTAVPRRRPQLVAQATTSLDRLSAGRMVLGLGLGVDSYGEYSVFDEAAVDDRARGAALDLAIPLLVPMLTGDAVPGAGGRVTTFPGVRRPRVPDLGRWASRPRRPGRGGSAATASRAWRSSAPTCGRPMTSRLLLAAGGLTAGEADVVLVGGSHADTDALGCQRRDLVRPEILPGATARQALAVAASSPR